jgi:anti-anti-sigma factor
MTPPLCSIEPRRERDACIVRLVGEIDLSNASAVESRLADLVRGEPDHRIVLELTDVEYLDSAAFAAIERLSRIARVSIVLSPTSPIHRAVAISGLGELVPIAPTLEELAAR